MPQSNEASDPLGTTTAKIFDCRISCLFFKPRLCIHSRQFLFKEKQKQHHKTKQHTFQAWVRENANIVPAHFLQ